MICIIRLLGAGLEYLWHGDTELKHGEKIQPGKCWQGWGVKFQTATQIIKLGLGKVKKCRFLEKSEKASWKITGIVAGLSEMTIIKVHLGFKACLGLAV